MKKEIFAVATLSFCLAASAQGGRDAFMLRQAYEEMKRVTQQIDVLESNFNGLSERISKMEGGGGEISVLKAEIEALKAEIRKLKGEMASQRGAIVSDLTRRLESIERTPASRQQPGPEKRPGIKTSDWKEYEVQSGDTLSLIGRAFNVSVQKLKAANGLKSDRLSIGMKILVPAPKGK